MRSPRESPRLPRTLCPPPQPANWKSHTGSETGGSATSKAWVDVARLRHAPSFRRWVVPGSVGEAERRRGFGLAEALVGRWVQTEGPTGRREAQWARNKGLPVRGSARRFPTGSGAAHRGFSANQCPRRAGSVGFSAVPHGPRRGGGPGAAAPAAEGPRGPPGAHDGADLR